MPSIINKFKEEHDLLDVSIDKDCEFLKIKIKTPIIANYQFGHRPYIIQKAIFKQITCFSDKAYAVSDSTLRTFTSLTEALGYVLECFNKEKIPTKSLNSIKFIKS